MSLNNLINEWARKGAAIKPLGRMCNDCAFKKGTPANNDDHTADVASQCVAFGLGEFVCHTPDFKDAGKPCMGFLYAKQYTDTLSDDKGQ